MVVPAQARTSSPERSSVSREEDAARSRGRGAGDFAIGSDPTWLLEPSSTPPGGNTTAESEVLLDDHQIRLGHGPIVQYWRRIRAINSTTGVQDSSEPEIEFDPTYEQLTLHHAWVLRGGKTIDVLDPGAVQVMQAESERNQRLYSGRLTAIVFLRDVRPGDIIDFAWSLSGFNPVYRERFAAELPLALGEPVRRLRHVLVAPLGHRPVSWRAHGATAQPQVIERDGLRVLVWQAENPPVPPDDGDVPAGFEPFPFIEISEFSDWAEVSRWAVELFQQTESGATSIEPLLEQFRNGATSPEQVALRAIRFVQDEIRYLGIEMGVNSHAPHTPDEVLSWRFGDCKDKSLLLSVLLRGLGHQATPALVHTELGLGLADRLPSPNAFDHVVLKAAINGRNYWIDPTVASQGGDLSRMAGPPESLALLVDTATRALSHIEQSMPAEPLTSVEERWNVSGAVARLAVRATYRGQDADDMRADLAQRSTAEVARAYLNQYARYDSTIRVTSKLSIEDDRDGNLLTTSESYELPGFSSNGRNALRAWLFEPLVRLPRTVLRSAPLAVEHPIWLRQTLVVHTTVDTSADSTETVTGPAFRFDISRSREHHAITHRYEYRSVTDRVAPTATSAHLRAMDDLAVRLELQLANPADSAGTERHTVMGSRHLVAASSALLALWLVRLVRARRRR